MRVTLGAFAGSDVAVETMADYSVLNTDVSDISQTAATGEWPIIQASFHLFRARLGDSILASQNILMKEKNPQKQNPCSVRRNEKESSERSLFSPNLRQLSETEVQNYNSAAVYKKGGNLVFCCRFY